MTITNHQLMLAIQDFDDGAEVVIEMLGIDGKTQRVEIKSIDMDDAENKIVISV